MRGRVGWAVAFAALAFAGGVPAAGQGTQRDYDRFAARRTLTRDRIFRDRVQPNWSPDGDRFWYRVATGPQTHEFVAVDAAAGKRRPAFDHARLAKALVGAGVKDARADRLAVDPLGLDPAGRHFDFRAAGRRWRCDRQTYKLTPLTERKDTGKAQRLTPPDRGPKASADGGAETAITFINHTDGDVTLLWLDGQGERRPYGRIAAGRRREQHTYAGHVWLVLDAKGRALGLHQAGAERATVEITAAPAGRGRSGRPGSAKPSRPGPRTQPAGRFRSPDGKWIASIQDHNVWVQAADADSGSALTTDGVADDGYEGRLYWSPDSARLVAMRCVPGDDHKVYLIESSPSDQVQPKLHSFTYRKPGDRVPIRKPHLFDVPGRKEISVSDKLFANPYRISDIRWAPDARRFTFVYNQRGHQVLRVLAVDAADGAVRAIVDERSKTFIHYSGKFFLKWLDGTNELIWMSERSGWNHLYLYDAETGKVKNAITAGQWLVRGVDRVDAEKRQVWFRAGGIVPGQDPYHVHYGRVNFDGTGLLVLTAGDGTHTLDYSPDGRFFLDTYSRVDAPPVTELRRTADGKRVCVLERADISALPATGWKAPIRFVAKGRDGTTDIYGVIYRPTTFDPARKYPVIEAIYAGPHSSFVPKAFRGFHWGQDMAELGFIVVRCDGMGTSNRSKAFHDVCWKNLADAGLPDRIAWIKAAAAKYPWMDITRVGIYGGSAGGQSAAAAVMTHGDFYKVAVADCGCHDNRMDKIWWNEQWMGWPVGPAYAANSNVTLAPGLKGKLLLLVGELDRNVDPASTMQVVNALIKADKDFDMLVVPGAGHGAAGTAYGRRRQADYFVRHLLGVEPRSAP